MMTFVVFLQYPSIVYVVFLDVGSFRLCDRI